MTGNSSKINKSYDKDFVVGFVNFFTENFTDDALAFKKALLTASLKEESTKKSLIHNSMDLRSQISEELKTNNNAILDIYLRNLEGIKDGLLKKIEEIKEIKEIEEKEELKTVVNEAFKILKNVRDGEPKIFNNFILFNSAEGLKNVISLRGRGNYCFGSVKAEGNNIMFHGEGAYTNANGDVYEGEFKDGKKDGEGIFRYANGDVFQGNFKDGKKDGKGVLKCISGDTYVHVFKNGEPNKEGFARFKDGTNYDGDFVNGKMDGQGALKFNDGTTYDGDFVNGEMDGPGTLKFTKLQDGSTTDVPKYYRGHFKNGVGKVYRSKPPSSMNQKEFYSDKDFTHNSRVENGKVILEKIQQQHTPNQATKANSSNVFKIISNGVQDFTAFWRS